MRILAVATVIAVLLAAATQPMLFPTGVSAAVTTVNVKISGFVFIPSIVTVVIGVNNTVKWTNQGSVAHTATADGGSFDSGILGLGASFTFTFNNTGTFAYHCDIHPSMKGTVIVKAQGSTTTATTSTTPTTTGTTTTSTTTTTVPFLPRLPPGVLAYVPITLHNPQSLPTPVGYNQMVVVNSSHYGPFEAPGLQNVKFFTKAGVTIPSWMESGASNASTATTYWLRLVPRIPAGGDLTVYLGFGDLGRNYLGRGMTGEAPQLGPLYGQFDNGLRVFRFYDNFHSLTAPLWAANLTGGGSSVRADSLAVTFGANPGYYASRRTFQVGTGFDVLILGFGDSDSLGYMRTTPSLHHSGDGKPNWSGSLIRSSCTGVFPDQFNSTGEANPCGGAAGLFFTATTGVKGVHSVGVLSKSTSLQSINYSQWGTTQPVSGNAPAYPARVGFTGQGASASAQWARVRTLPLGGVMPTVTIGNVQVRVVIARGAFVSSNPLFFVPSSLMVTPGTIVIWVNKDIASHTVTADDSLFGSGTLPPGGAFAMTFPSAGLHAYHCAFHPWMTGTINVTSG